MSNTTAAVLETETAYTLWIPGFTLDFLGSVLLIYLVFLCCVAFWIFGCVCLRLVCLLLSVSLGCPFVIVTSVFF